MKTVKVSVVCLSVIAMGLVACGGSNTEVDQAPAARIESQKSIALSNGGSAIVSPQNITMAVPSKGLGAEQNYGTYLGSVSFSEYWTAYVGSSYRDDGTASYICKNYVYPWSYGYGYCYFWKYTGLYSTAYSCIAYCYR